MLFYIIIALFLGCVNVLSRSVSFKATQYLGQGNGTLVNYVTGTIASAVLLLFFGGSTLHLSAFAQVPSWLYLGGVFGTIAFFLNIASLHRMNLFQSAVLLLIGQLTGSFLLDAFLYQSASWMKLIGIIILGIGVIWDKKVSAQNNSSADCKDCHGKQSFFLLL